MNMSETDNNAIREELNRVSRALEKLQTAKRGMGCYMKEAFAHNFVKLCIWGVPVLLIVGAIYFYAWKPISNLSRAPGVAIEYISDAPSKMWCAMPWTCSDEVEIQEQSDSIEVEEVLPVTEIIIDLTSEPSELEVVVQEEPGLWSKRPSWMFNKQEEIIVGEESP